MHLPATSPRRGSYLSLPVLDLDGHEHGVQATIRFDRMRPAERLHFVAAAMTALITGSAQFDIAHARTLHRGHLTQLRFDDQSADNGWSRESVIADIRGEDLPSRPSAAT